MSKFNAIIECMSNYNQIEEMDRQELINMYYKYSPRSYVDMIDIEEESKRVNTIPIDELRKEVDFYMFTYGY